MLTYKESDLLGTIEGILRTAEMRATNTVRKAHIKLLRPVVLEFSKHVESNALVHRTLKTECQDYWQKTFRTPLPQAIDSLVHELAVELREVTNLSGI